MKVFLLIIISIFFFSCSTDLSTVQYSYYENVKYNINEIINDMFLPNEGIPAGVPDSYMWKHMPTSKYMVKFPDGWNSLMAWGVIYPEQSLPNPDVEFPFIRVHIKDLQLYFYMKDGSWVLNQTVQNPIGYLYVADFNDDLHYQANIRDEDGGGISVQVGAGFNFHFWSKRTVVENPDNIKDIFVVCKARLIGTEKYDKPSKYIISMGGDYWKNFDSEYEPNVINVTEIASSRFKYLTPEWQLYTMHTFTKNEANNVKFPLE